MNKLISAFIIFSLIILTSSVSAQEDTNDPSAELFFYRCAGCHTIGKGNLSGPDLIRSIQWSDVDLGLAIKKMEKNTGPLNEKDIQDLIKFLKDIKVSDRLDKQRKRIEASLKANLPDPSWETGRKLFHGQQPLANRGPACFTCHYFVNSGGNLGLDLTTINTRVSAVVLQSSIEASSYKIMRSIYATHKITPEESLHLAEYLTHPEKVQPKFSPTAQSVTALGITLSGAFFVLLWFINKSRKKCIREELRQRNIKG